MKRQLVSKFGIMALAVGLTACSSAGGPSQDAGGSAADPKNATGTVTVWLMDDAQKNWPDLVQRVNDDFAAKYPKVTLRLAYQGWADKVGKLDKAIADGNAPDVVELGNTETMKYVLSGALAAVDRTTFDNSDSWIKALANTCTYQDKLWCVPYYAGARVAIYNATAFQQATGSADFPKTEADLTAALDKIADRTKADRNYSPLYLPGPYWYAAMSYVAAAGGSIAKFDSSGNWHGTLHDAKSQQGIAHFADLVRKYNKGDLTVNEQNQYEAMARGRAATFYGNGYEAASVIAPGTGDPTLKDAVKVATMPGPDGKPLPTFIGGSDLAVTAKSQQVALAADWIRMFTGTKSQQALADKDILPNNLTQLNPLKSRPNTAAAANAVPDAWFTPLAPGWGAVEKQKIIPDMLAAILKGKSVDQATKDADAAIDQLINNPS
ncbi:extracellular solute-binding protein [Streptomyces sp. SP17BM10]|uniref:extracellular solute-binding protein n=1 Tax=Streptomyces sp. SP17BM10 TaxID=3002530 RepID=UPI002E784B7A|nr:extracellular solute-binding protein [Streptomyces sp. SP17BM10]MEE1784810.1 extracellular solute-binding protein [Streptomyces sp. SP17BM10]